MLLRLLPNWMSKDPGCGKTLLCPIRLPEIHKIRYELPLALGDQFELAKGRCENRFPWKAPTATGELLNSTNILILLLLGIYLIEYID